MTKGLRRKTKGLRRKTKGLRRKTKGFTGADHKYSKGKE